MINWLIAKEMTCKHEWGIRRINGGKSGIESIYRCGKCGKYRVLRGVQHD